MTADIITDIHDALSLLARSLARSFIVFRASDVKDLKIEQDAPKQQPPPPAQLQDPAIMSSVSGRLVYLMACVSPDFDGRC